MNISLQSRFLEYLSSSVISQVIEPVKKNFKIFEGVFLIGYGTHEVMLQARKMPASDQISSRINVLFWEIFNGLFVGNAKSIYPLVHGSLLAVSGVYTLLAGIQENNLYQINISSFPLVEAGQILFVAAAIFAIKHYTKAYMKLQQEMGDIKLENSQVAILTRKQQCALLGLISNIFYTISGMIPLLGFQSSLSLVFGGMALSTSCAKILNKTCVKNE